MLPAFGSLWVSSVDEAVVQRVDPDLDELAATVEDVGIVPDGLFELDGAVWVASDSGPEIHRIDPGTEDVTGPWIVADQGSINANQLVVALDGELWLPLLESGEVVAAVPPAAA
jgi:streptogramin lyase